MGSSEPVDATIASAPRQAGKAYVRVLGTRLGRFVEFEYSLGDGVLAIELILPFVAFDEFCRVHDAILLPPEDSVSADLDRLAWRAGQPGLLHRPMGRPAGEA